ncbi:hypothetical protein BDA96_10G196700 [Sorghum bicolor]|uniref:Uncharacterized protein n=1 Tax=Sorghum bicolor TaxID=4558 RepID=A0A921U1A7_SORBI|nr:hypothetical protein BDA96_10G196700 [Sorghum bicolor]
MVVGLSYSYSCPSIFETYGSYLMAARKHRQFSMGFFCEPIHILQASFLVSGMH